MINWADDNHDFWVNRNIWDIRRDKETLNYEIIRTHIKFFFRSNSARFMIENGEFSKSLTKCHRVMIENYPHYSDDLNDVMNLFLNIEEYSGERIREDLNKILLFVKSLRSKKRYRIKVTKR